MGGGGGVLVCRRSRWISRRLGLSMSAALEVPVVTSCRAGEESWSACARGGLSGLCELQGRTFSDGAASARAMALSSGWQSTHAVSLWSACCIRGALVKAGRRGRTVAGTSAGRASAVGAGADVGPGPASSRSARILISSLSAPASRRNESTSSCRPLRWDSSRSSRRSASDRRRAPSRRRSSTLAHRSSRCTTVTSSSSSSLSVRARRCSLAAVSTHRLSFWFLEPPVLMRELAVLALDVGELLLDRRLGRCAAGRRRLGGRPRRQRPVAAGRSRAGEQPPSRSTAPGRDCRSGAAREGGRVSKGRPAATTSRRPELRGAHLR